MRIEKDRLILDLTCSTYSREYDAFLFVDNKAYLLLKKTSRESKNEKTITKKLVNGILENTKNYYLFKTSFRYKELESFELYDFLNNFIKEKHESGLIISQIFCNTIELCYAENFMEEKGINTTFQERKKKVISMINYHYLENKFDSKKEEKKLKI